MRICFLIGLFILGACLGSFLCCEARRLYLKGKEKLGPRSVCLSCKTKLKWYDNIPIFSWLFLRGKCRKCSKKIGALEFLSELGVGLAFLCLGTTFDPFNTVALDWPIFIITLILTLILCFLAIYDGMCGELPLIFLFLAIIFSLVLVVLKIFYQLQTTEFSVELILKPLVSAIIIGGLYLILHFISRGKWVGDGDWLLGLSIGLALFEPYLSAVALFTANVVACLVMLPFLKKSKHKKIYFGPFMVLAFVLTLTFSDFFLYALGGFVL